MLLGSIGAVINFKANKSNIYFTLLNKRKAEDLLCKTICAISLLQSTYLVLTSGSSKYTTVMIREDNVVMVTDDTTLIHTLTGT